MHKIKRIFRKLRPSPKARTSLDVNALRLNFKERYHTFKLLLRANNKSLEIMADIESLLREGRPFGMSAVKANCTAVSVSVYSMIQKLDKLAPDKYQALFTRFHAIQDDINSRLKQKPVAKDHRLTIPLSAIDMSMSDLVGGKMANLGEIKNKAGLKVPDGFVITSGAFEAFFRHNGLQDEINRKIQACVQDDMHQLYQLSCDIQQMIIAAEIPQDLTEAVNLAVSELDAGRGEKITLALRSSALGEDSADASFAGQYRSILNVSAENMFTAYKEVVASKYSLTAISYRLSRGFRDEDIPICVGCIAMVDAVAGGVAYSHNPFEIHDNAIFINATWGLPKPVVDGSAACDLFVVSRKPDLTVTHRNIGTKDKKFVCYPEEGLCRIDLSGEEKHLPSLSDDMILNLAATAIKMESYYGTPLDIEWAISGQDPPVLSILQCRPLKQKSKPGKTAPPPATVEYMTIISRGGITASSGAAAGEAYIAKNGADILNFPDGAVLITQKAEPAWAPLLSRAAAVVTEQGGFAGHLANVAREFDVPALFSVPEITRNVRQGEIITVDADGLSVHRGKVTSLLSQETKKQPLMKGSPVYRILEQVSRRIVPLHLLDPDSALFQAKNCTTFHDITRFIHEKSIHEMFHFGKSHDFSEKSSKQLYYKVPMQWWILDLDDGFNKDISGKYVRLEDIASIPMLALWEGIIAVPWDGPPPIDKKGLVSVMFQATANTALNTGTRSKYSERNYFMVSKHYCNLSSRLGFHFSTIEALVTDRFPENYIQFRFQGGAADYERRLRRVRFVGDFLSDYGFAVQIKEDNMAARIEGHEAAFMIGRLKIIGYLTIHTRQLDMIMSNPAMVTRYRKKFKTDIETFFSIT